MQRAKCIPHLVRGRGVECLELELATDVASTVSRVIGHIVGHECGRHRRIGDGQENRRKEFARQDHFGEQSGDVGKEERRREKPLKDGKVRLLVLYCATPVH